MEPRLLYSADLTGGLMLASATADTAAPEVRTVTDGGEYATTAGATTAATSNSAAATVAATYAASSLTFAQGSGTGADFTASGSGYGIALKDGSATLSLLTDAGQQDVTLRLAGASATPAAEGEGLLATRTNVLVGSDASQWRTDVANYNAVTYRDVYDGVDVRYYGNQRQLEYDFVVAAGADAGVIRLQFQGSSNVAVDADGNLVLQVAGSDNAVRFNAPVAYQVGADGQLQAVASRYEVQADGSVGFVLGAYDHSRALVIDPVLDYASYFGDTGNETALAVTTDASGNVYVTGRTTTTSASSGPLATAIGGGGGAGDIFVAKFNSDLTQLLWSTRIGGTGDDQGNAIAVDASGNVAVTGWTKSTNFPTLNASQGSMVGGQDAVILKLNASGGLVFSTYLGGNSATDSGNAVAFDAAGNVYAAGEESDTGLLPLVLQLLFGNSDNAFVNKYDASGTLVWSQMLGGSSTDLATGIAVDASGNSYVVGNTQSTNMATVDAQQTSLSGAIDGFLTRLDASGNTVYSTYVGGTDADTTKGVAIDGSGDAYVVGVTRARSSVVFTTTTGAFMTSSPANNKDTGFLREYDTTKTGAASLVYSSYLGGSGSDLPSGIAYSNGRVVVVGLAGSTNFPVTADAVQATNAGSSMFVAVLRPAGAGSADLEFGSYYGGNMTAGGVAVSADTVYFVAGSSATGYATSGTYQSTKSGASDALIVAITGTTGTTVSSNTAPTLNGVVQPPSIAEDNGGGSGFSVASLIAGQVTDPDAGAQQGIAIVGSDESHGTWQYSLDNGSTWAAVGATSVTSALLLGADSQTLLRFVPAADYNGSVAAALTVRAWDRTSGAVGGMADTSNNGGHTSFSIASFAINLVVTPVNDAPVANADVLAAVEDTPITYAAADLLGNDTDVDSPVLSIASVTSGTGGIVVRNADGTVTFTPAANFNGTATFSYTVTDGSLSSSAGVTVNVAAVNDPPVANADSFTTAEDTALTINLSDLLANDTDVENSALSVVSVANGTGGTVVLNGNGTVKFTPGADFNGAASFTYVISDGTANSAPATVGITVTPVDDAPVANDDSFVTNEDTPLTLTAAQLLGNDTDVEHDPLTIVSVTGAVLNADGSVTFTPAANFNGTTNFHYRISDGSLVSNDAKVTVVVQPVNDPPVAVGDNLQAVSGTPVTYAPNLLLGNDTDVDGPALSIASVTSGAGGTAVLNADGSVTFTSVAGFAGNASFTYAITDGSLVSAPATVNVLVNDVPAAHDDTLAATEDTAVTYAASALLGNDVDLVGNPLVIASVGNASGGSVVLNANGTVTFTPNANFNGPAAFTYTASDGSLVSSPANVTVNVAAVNDAPTNAPVTLPGMAEDSGTTTITAAQLLANAADVDGDALTVTGLVVGPGTGALVANTDGTWSFTPAANFNGPVTFTYQVSDGTVSVAGSAGLAVSAVNDAPTTSPVTLVPIDEDSGPLTITSADLLANAADVEHDPLAVSNVAATAGSGTLLANGNGTWTFTPGANYNGTVAFSYDISDGTATTAGTASLVVNPVNDAPATSPVTLAPVAEDSGPLTITSADLLANASDVDGDALSVANVQATAGAGTLVANGGGTWTFTPGANYNGTVAFSYDVSDGTAVIGGTASLDVTPVNDAPVTSLVTLSPIDEDSGPLTITSAQLLAHASDVDGDALSVANVQATAGAGTLVANGGGTWTFTPGANYNGNVGFTYDVSDGTAITAGTAGLLVNPVNDAPTTSAVVLPAIAEDSGSLTITSAQLLANAADVDHDTLSVANLVATPGTGTLVASGGGTWTFTPGANYNGTVAFSYDISDGTALAAGTASLSVTAVNDAPTTSPVTLPAVAEDSGSVTITSTQLLANAADADHDPLTVANVLASTGALVANGNGTWTFTPGANYNGTVSFTYDIGDGTTTTAGTASMDVTPVNDAPTTSPVTLPAIAEDSGSLTITSAQLLANAADVDHDTLSVANLVATPGAGTLVANGNGTWTFTPGANYNGTVGFTYDVSDGTALTAGDASLSVTPVNDAPTTSPVTLPAIAEDSGSVTITSAQLLANASDIDGDALSVANVLASTGALVANGNGTWTFTPGANYNGTVAFTYDVSDGTALTAGSASLSVTPVNDAPTTSPVTLPAMAEDSGSITITSAQLLANAADAENDALSVANVVASTGTLVANGNGTWTFTPGADYNGSVGFTYGISDGTATTPGGASLAVTPVNDAPRITSDGGQPAATVDVPENTTAVTTVSASDVDSPSQSLVFSINGGADAALFVVDPATGRLAFAHAPDYEAPSDANHDNVYEVVVQVSDGSLAGQQALSVRVDDVADTAAPSAPPVAAPAAAPAPAPAIDPGSLIPAAPAPAPSAAPVASAPAPAPAAAVAPATNVAGAGASADSGPGATGGTTRSPRTTESIQDALGPTAPSAIASFNSTEVSFASAPAHLVLEADTSRVLRTVVFDRTGIELISTQPDANLMLARFGIDSHADSSRLLEFQRSLRSSAFSGQLDRLREGVRQDLDLDRSVNISVVSVSLGLSLVYVLWLIRGGVLLGSYLSALPAWRLLDPLPVLSRVDDEEEDEELLGDERQGGRDTLRGFG